MAELLDIPFDEYVKLPGINATSLKKGRDSMMAMHAEMTGAFKEENDSMAWGRKVHSAVLEPDTFLPKIKTIEVSSKRVKAWTEFANEHGDYAMTKSEYDCLVATSNAVHANEHAHRLITAMDVEQTIVWKDRLYGEAKCRIDLRSDRDGIADLKTARDISDRKFAASAFDLGYPMQFAWYREANRLITGNVAQCHIIAVTNKPPFDCRVFTFFAPELEALLDAELEQAIELAKLYRCCAATKRFSGVSSTIDPLPIPAWAKKNGKEDSWVVGGDDDE